jgi:hypothetical protein
MQFSLIRPNNNNNTTTTNNNNNNWQSPHLQLALPRATNINISAIPTLVTG